MKITHPFEFACFAFWSVVAGGAAIAFIDTPIRAMTFGALGALSALGSGFCLSWDSGDLAE